GRRGATNDSDPWAGSIITILYMGFTERYISVDQSMVSRTLSGRRNIGGMVTFWREIFISILL
ncbi:MAG TPA: hypothetical protein VK597_12200, partial [Inquilinus sp.]|nr:hypothetical protein [Inquilinus sp.]